MSRNIVKVVVVGRAAVTSREGRVSRNLRKLIEAFLKKSRPARDV